MNRNLTSGKIFTAIVSLGFVLAIFFWFNLFKTPVVSVEQIKKNEINTYLQLKKIAIAQEKYIKEDWDGDGELEYSVFMVHLWKTIISKDGNTKLLRFVPKKVGFATESSYALDGYVYTVLHYYNKVRIDYTKEWAVYASPLERRRTGSLSFIIDYTGNIMVSETQIIYNNDYPYEPNQNGWVSIKSIDGLKYIQEKTEYLVE